MSVSTGASDTKAQRISYVHDASDSEVGLGASGLAIDVEVLRSTVGTQNSPEGPSKQPVLQSRYHRIPPTYTAVPRDPFLLYTKPCSDQWIAHGLVIDPNSSPRP